MASSSGARWRLDCDACDAQAWVGASGAGFDAWCEACQSSHPLAGSPSPDTRCPRCAVVLPPEPRFVELWGELQQLSAVLGAWGGDLVPLLGILPERPRFTTDLCPPPGMPGDPPALRAQLAALARGAWREVLAAPDDPRPRSHAARAIAHERVGEPAAAIAEWGAVLEAGEDARARLARGALLARSGRLAEAGADLARAGGSEAARWDRASLLVHEAIAAGAGAPEPALVARARAEAGPASAYWSEPTVGRLLWSLLVECELARLGERPGRLAAPSRELLRRAEAELEHETFWDRSLLLAGWARLGEGREAARVAEPLARGAIAGLLAEPALAGRALAPVAGALVAAGAALDGGEPLGARDALAGPLDRDDLRRFRIPCARCLHGTVGVAEISEVAGCDPRPEPSDSTGFSF